MKEGTRNLLVGTFVLVAIGALGLLMVWFGEAPSWLGGSRWTLRITDVQGLAGLDDGSPVILNGVQIGRVRHSGFEDPSRPHEGVVIVADIVNTFSVPHNAIARVYGATMGFGTGHVEIACEPGTSAEPLDKKSASIRGEMRSVFGELISNDIVNSVETAIKNIAALAESATPVMKNVADLTEQRRARTPETVANISTIVQEIDELLQNLNVVLGDGNVQDDVKAVVGDLKSAAEGFRQTVETWQTESQRTSDNVNTGIDRTRENLHESFAKLNTVLENLDESSRMMAKVLRRVEQGEGTAGHLVRDDRLYEAAVLAFERLGELTGTLQRIFGKVEKDGYMTIGKRTPIGTITGKISTPKIVEKLRSKLTRRESTDSSIKP